MVTDARGRPVPSAGLSAWLARVAPARARGTVTVALVSDARVRALNRQYRGTDYATDVLSFSYGAWGPTPTRSRSALRHAQGRRPGGEPVEPRLALAAGAFPTAGARRPVTGRLKEFPSPEPRAPSPYLGDIVIARGVARRQARLQGHGERVELRVLALHGLLHLLGYDHERDTGQMARLEEKLRRKGGLIEGLMARERRPVLATREHHRASASGAGVMARERRPVLATREHHRASASGAGVGPRAIKR